jgi:hypothetical protein
MSHFPVLVLTERELEPQEAEDAVGPLLELYSEEGEWFAEGTRWDWWAVGGRWSGVLGGVEPTDDLDNYEVCWLCDGTGVRPGGRERFGDAWFKGCNGCNGCSGNGCSLKHPAEWKQAGNVARLADVPTEFVPTAVVTPDGKWHEEGRMGWFGMMRDDEQGNGPKPEAVWAAAVRALLEQHPEATAILVDCHV